jgi:hypothetical protein
MMMRRRMMTMMIFMIIKKMMMIPGLSSLFVTVEVLLEEDDFLTVERNPILSPLAVKIHIFDVN